MAHSMQSMRLAEKLHEHCWKSSKPRSNRLPPKFGHLQRAVRRLNRQICRAPLVWWQTDSLATHIPSLPGPT